MIRARDLLQRPPLVRRFYTVEELAELTGLSHHTIRNKGFRERQQLTAVRIAGRLRFPVASVDEWLNRCDPNGPETEITTQGGVPVEQGAHDLVQNV